MDDRGFTHLHLHSQYSLLDGAIRMDELCPQIKAQGMNSVAVTDHGNMFGAIHFYKQAMRHGVKPIIGCEAYVAGPKGRKDRSDRSSAHMVLLAKDNEGYKNLSYLVSMAYQEGFYYHPRIDRDLLRKHSKGIFATSACLGGVVNKCYLKHGEAKAAEVAREFQDIFEPGHFFLEIQDNGYEIQNRANEVLMEIGRTYNIPMVATADSHYLRPEDSAAHEILMCIGMSLSQQEFRQKMSHSDLLYIKSPEEMWQSFGKSCPEALDNVNKIAAACNVELDLSQTYLPNYGVPKGYTRESYLEDLSNQGLKRRFAEMQTAYDEKAYRQRLEYELSVINKMGFAGYFLIVWDFIKFAKGQTIPVGPGRGSGAGSLVAFALRITDLDPIPYDLLFERFLNPERVSMPDFDIDFCQDRRSEVIDYVAERYGRENVGQIVTYSALSAKSVIKDVGRVLGVPFAEINALTKLIPGLVNGKKVSIDQALQIEPKLREIQKEKPIYEEIINTARRLEGLNRQTGVHAAGVVIGDKPLHEYVPLCRGKEGEIVTQFAKDEVEEAGLVKFDFLGLKTLTVIARAIAHIHVRPDKGPQGPNTEFDIGAIPLNDPKVYALIARSDTDGVFQLESTGFKELLKRLKPDCFEDIVAAVALYRPGPLDAGMVEDYIARKHGKKKIAYPHPACENVLKTTYGVIVYQEQVMRIAVELCGFSLGQSDILRKAMGKKKADVMAKMRAKFVDGAHAKHAMPKQDAEDLFTLIEKFAGYAFNKSHSAAYALITYQTAYLKTYFPVAFMAALLSTEMGDQDDVVKYIQSAREHGIVVKPPDVNRSYRDFSVVQEEDQTYSILFGLGAVKGIGESAIDAILHARSQEEKEADAKNPQDDASFGSLYDFCERVDARKLNKKVLDTLIKSGACDTFKRPRAQMSEVIERALESGQRVQKDEASGQTSFFTLLSPDAEPQGGDDAQTASSVTSHGTQESYPDLPEWRKKMLLSAEKESLGFYVTGHPLDSYAEDIPRLTSTHTANLQTLNPSPRGFREEVRLAGVISAYRERPLKSGNGRMAFLTLEDRHGTCEVLVFSKVFAATEHLLKGDDPILLVGAPMMDGDDEGGTVKIRATQIHSLSHVRAEKTKKIAITLPAKELSEQRAALLKDLLPRHPGPAKVQLTLVEDDLFETVVQLPPRMHTAASEELLWKLGQALGDEAKICLS